MSPASQAIAGFINGNQVYFFWPDARQDSRESRPDEKVNMVA
jgi:hypothetical protein